MPPLDRLSQIARNNLLTFPAQVNETAPFVRPSTPLAGRRLAIVTTAGLHVRGDRPFAPGDQTYRAIPSDTPTADIVQSHTSTTTPRTARTTCTPCGTTRETTSAPTCFAPTTSADITTTHKGT